MRFFVLALAWCLPVCAADYRTPAGERTAIPKPGAESVLPGGRLITPRGQQFRTGPGPFGLAVNPAGDIVVSANGGPSRFSLTALSREGKLWRTEEIETEGKRKEDEPDDPDAWRSVFMGLAFDGAHDLYASEGNSGKVRYVNAYTGKTNFIYDLNQGGYHDSYTADLALDKDRGLLYVVDQANFRLVVIDAHKHRIVSSVRVGRLPFAMALSPDGRRAYVANLGMFEYKALPGADRKKPIETGLEFPAFGFPSAEAEKGARRMTTGGNTIDVPGLGDPNVQESNSVCAVDVSNPAAPVVTGFVRTGRPFGNGISGGSSPSGVVATKNRVFVSNGHNDSITVIDAGSMKVLREVELRVPGLEGVRGVLPIGMAFHAGSGHLLVAEAGINAVGVIDPEQGKVLGHIPAGWFPTRVALDDNMVWVTNAKGHGTGPNADWQRPIEKSYQGDMRRGSISRYELPADGELARLTEHVWHNNGFVHAPSAPPVLPPELKYVVIIVKENRTYDEVFGDIETASNGVVRGAPDLARFGRRGIVSSRTGDLKQRMEVKSVNVSPNHRDMALRWAFSDNFYADSEVSVDGHHWIVGSYPNAFTESTLMAAYGGQKDFRLPTSAPGRLLFPGSNSSVHPEEQLEAGALWHHLDRHGITFRNFGEGFELAGADEGEGLKPTGARFLTNVPMPDPLYRNTSRQYPNYNTNIPDQFRATQFIKEMDELYAEGKQPFPRLLFLHLPNDHTARARPEDGYPFTASYIADNDYALGRIVQYLSRLPQWKEMAMFVTEDDAQGGVDHIDSHRTVLLVASPYAKRNYVSRVNTSFPGLLKTVFRILRLPPLNLYDAAAADLSDCFTTTPDFTPFNLLPVSPAIFDPWKAKEPSEPVAPPIMDDPAVLREQHRQQK
ncbi:MAG: alkaline phosphatase family protein [Bryobacteraceae bacterium]